MQAVARAETIEGLKTKRLRRISRIITEKVEKDERTEKKLRKNSEFRKKVLDKAKKKWYTNKVVACERQQGITIRRLKNLPKESQEAQVSQKLVGKRNLKVLEKSS